MKRLLLLLLAALLLLSTVSCVTTGARFIKTDLPLSDESNVYIYRPFHAMGSGSSPALMHNGKKIQSVLPVRTFFKYSVKPGTHTFKTSLLLVRAVPVTIESKQPGETHYIRVEYQFGVPFAFKMVEVSEAEAMAELPGCFDITGKKAATETRPVAEPRVVTPVKSVSVVAAPTIRKVGKASLFVSVSPENARVRILNIKPVFRQGLELSEGRYHIEVSAKGYQLDKQWINLAQGESRQLRVELQPVAAPVTQAVIVATPVSRPLSKIKEPEIARLAAQLQDKSPIVKRDAAKRISRSYPANPQLLAVVQNELEKGYMVDSQNRYHTDAMAWYCKYLGASGDGNYKEFLLKVAAESSNRKLRDYAKKSAAML